jgi:hypothetical protein
MNGKWGIASSEWRMANGEWKATSRSLRLSLQGADRMPHPAAEGATARHDILEALDRYDADALREQKMRLELLERPLRYPEELDEGTGTLATMSLRDIGGDGCRRATNLGCHPE